MCCGFHVTVDGRSNSGAIFTSGGDHEPDPEQWIHAMKKAATWYYQAVRANPDKTVALMELANPCDDFRTLAVTYPGEETQQVDPTKACPDVRAWIEEQGRV